MRRSRKSFFFSFWTSSAVTFDSGEDDAAAAAWLCAGELIREMNPQVKLLAGGGAAGVSQVASSCRRLPRRRPPRWDLEGFFLFIFFFSPLGLQPDGGPLPGGTPNTPTRLTGVTAAVRAKQSRPSAVPPEQMILCGWWLRNTCGFLCDRLQTIAQWLHPRRYFPRLVPSLQCLSSDVFIVFVFFFLSIV